LAVIGDAFPLLTQELEPNLTTGEKYGLNKKFNDFGKEGHDRKREK